MSDNSSDGTERVDGDALDAEAHALEDIFNSAKADHSPKLEWFAMRYDHETETQYFFLEAEQYVDSDGLDALRRCGREIHYIEANGLDDEQRVGIEVAVQGTVPSSPDTVHEGDDS